MVARVKKNDRVMVLAGKDKDKTGTVIALSFKHDKVMVKDIAIVTRHVKARKQGEASSIKKEESFIALSNVMPVCSSCKNACRVNTKVLEDGKRVRTCNNCKEIF
ncbi:MAG: 50S ribosomal protein L24 [Candidatus Dependentiae bacterium]|nr:50S ribosomal protein L24 [Candidatus Dependentiae bacterium]